MNTQRVKRFVMRSPRLYRAALFLRKAVLGTVMRALHAAFGARRQAVFSSFHGLVYGDGPMRVSEKLHELDPALPIVWILSPGCPGWDRVPDYVKTVRPRSLKALLELSRSAAAVDDFNQPYYRYRGRDQSIVQLWHGDRPFKKVMFDAFPSEPFPDPDITDLCVSGSRFGTELYRRAFRYRGEVLECGTPRCDILADPPPGLASRVRGTLGISEKARVLLYAPTFRAQGGSIPPLDLKRVKSALSSSGEEWVTLSRAHIETGSLASGADRDVSLWPDMNELLLISDALVTDYSSCAADFALLDRRIALYRPDEDKYGSTERGLYFTSSPFACARDEDRLIAILADPSDPAPNCAEIRRFFGMFETGNASQATARAVLNLITGGHDK